MIEESLVTRLPIEEQWSKTAGAGIEIARSNYKPTRADAIPVVFRTRINDGYVSTIKQEETTLRRFAEGRFEDAIKSLLGAAISRSESFQGEVASEQDILYVTVNAEYRLLDENDDEITPYLDAKTLRDLAQKAGINTFVNRWRR